MFYGIMKEFKWNLQTLRELPIPTFIEIGKCMKLEADIIERNKPKGRMR